MRSLSCGLSLDRSQIGFQGATAIADALKVNGALTALSLGDNRIGDQGATAIADALNFNGSLTELNLIYNNIGGAAQATLRAAKKPSLTNLAL